jgi:hypothetical protein
MFIKTQRLGVHAKRGNGRGNRVGVGERMANAQHAVDQVEVQLLDASQLA